MMYNKLLCIRLKNFRCYRLYDLNHPHESIIVQKYQQNWTHISGPNGSGKTSVLEAISLLVPGRGIRNADSIDLRFMDDKDEWKVAIEFNERILTVEPHNNGRKITDSTGQRRWYQDIAVFWITPQSAMKFFTSKAERRHCLDKWIGSSSVAYRRALSRYNKAYICWSKSCKDAPNVSTTFEKILNEEGEIITALRGQWLQQLPTIYPLIRVDIECDPKEELDWKSARRIGIANGPHRADLRLIGHKDHKTASTGEQKLLLFTLVHNILKMHNAELKLLLLDDWSENFDTKNRIFIKERILESTDIQVLSSGIV